MLENVKNYWAYKEIEERYKITIREKANEKGATITIDYLGGVKFNIIKETFQNITFYRAFDNYGDITQELEYTDTLEDIIKSCLYYFITRY